MHTAATVSKVSAKVTVTPSADHHPAEYEQNYLKRTVSEPWLFSHLSDSLADIVFIIIIYNISFVPCHAADQHS